MAHKSQNEKSIDVQKIEDTLDNLDGIRWWLWTDLENSERKAIDIFYENNAMVYDSHMTKYKELGIDISCLSFKTNSLFCWVNPQ